MTGRMNVQSSPRCDGEFRVSRRDIKLDSEPFNKRWLEEAGSNKTFAGVLACSEATEPRRINGRVIMKRDAEIARFVKRRGMPDACWRSSAFALTVCKLMVTRFNSAINRGHPCSGHQTIAYSAPFCLATWESFRFIWRVSTIFIGPVRPSCAVRAHATSARLNETSLFSAPSLSFSISPRFPLSSFPLYSIIVFPPLTPFPSLFLSLSSATESATREHGLSVSCGNPVMFLHRVLFHYNAP